MITYHLELFGFSLLPRAHGSAVYRACLPSAISTSLILIAYYGFDLDPSTTEALVHPYAIGVFVAFFTYVVTFRANFAYQRYWEGATAVHNMMSKWLDVGMNIAAYHYQGRQYQKVRPPAFGKNPHVRNMTRERERLESTTEEEMRAKLEQAEEEARARENQSNVIVAMWERRKQRKRQRSLRKNIRKRHLKSITSKSPKIALTLPVPTHHASLHRGRTGHRRGETRPSQQFSKDFLQSVQQEYTHEGGVETPSLFLQESAHLLSLLSAVAMSTLRLDSMEAELPLVEHIPGRPWPPVDPDSLSSSIRAEFNESSRYLTAARFLLGLKRRNYRQATLYNAARPFRVLGGISDCECEELQKTRGPEAKVALCSKWLQEFISREYMAGSTGGVAPPIISRLYQFTSDGTLGYNHCRKIAFIPFPFPHAQLSTCFVGVCVFVFPLLYYSYVPHVAFACILNFITVMCFVGVNEVARELEAPFRNVPNDLPLTTFQAQFNEALIAMYAGFHPDAWSVEDQVSVKIQSAEERELNESTTTKNSTESTERPSDGSLDLIAFFRKEREEAEKNSKLNQGNNTDGDDSKAASRAVPNPGTFGDCDGHGTTTTAPAADQHADPMGILRMATATLFGDVEETDSFTRTETETGLSEPKSILKKQPRVAAGSPEPKSILRKPSVTSPTTDEDGGKKKVDLQLTTEKLDSGKK